jgi:fused signal recognition particle receptor
MFEFFKKRVKDAFSKFTRSVDEESKELEPTPEEKKVLDKIETEKKEREEKEASEKKEIKEETKKPSDKEDKKDDSKTPKEETKKETSEEPKPSEKEEKGKIDKSVLKGSTPETETTPDKEINVEDKEGVILKKGAENKETNPVKKSFFQKINPFAKKTEVPNEEKFEDEKEAKKKKRAFSDEYLTGEKKTFINKISDSLTKKQLSESQFHDMFWDLEIALLENNVAVEVVDLLKGELRDRLVNKPLPRSKIPEVIEGTLKETIEKIFELEPIDLIRKASQKKPFKILIVGINGSGKTTTIAKLAKMFQDNNLKPVIAAADTFRAAAIDQLQEHADNLKVKMIKHDYGSDPAAVAFDAIKYAEAKGNDIVIIDTAGRLHSNSNLMDELKKVNRIANPDITLFVGESITGNDCVEQAKEFNKAISIDGIILSKADIDEKGGAAISISYVIGKPILYLGVGQGYNDLESFDKYKIMYRMFGAELQDSE